MQAEYYIFVVFVFLAALGFVALAKKIWIKGSPRSAQLQEKEVKLFKLYQHVEDLMDGLEEYVDEVSETIAAEKAQVSKLVREAVGAEQNIKLQMQETQYLQKVQPVPIVPATTVDFYKNLKKKPPVTKNEKILALHNEGMGIDQITKELSLGKGEVALVLHLEEAAKNM